MSKKSRARSRQRSKDKRAALERRAAETGELTPKQVEKIATGKASRSLLTRYKLAKLKNPQHGVKPPEPPAPLLSAPGSGVDDWRDNR